MTDLNPILSASVEGATINLTSSTIYTTSGYVLGDVAHQPVLKNGCTLNGHGATILVQPPVELTTVNGIYGVGNNTVDSISLVIDAVTSGSNAKRNGIWLIGPGPNTVTNCQVYGQYGTKLYDKESFGIVASGYNGIIDNCSVSDVQGDYVSAIVGLTSSLISSCSVSLPHPRTPDAGQFWVAYNIQSDGGSLVADCTSDGGRAGVYGDYMSMIGLTIRDCTFTDCAFGLHLNAQEYVSQSFNRIVSNIEMFNCTIKLDSNVNVNGTCGVLLDHTWTPFSLLPNPTPKNRITNIKIKRNTIRLNIPTGTPYTGSNVIYVANIATNTSASNSTKGISNILFEDNIIDSRITTWRNYSGSAANLKVITSSLSIPWVNAEGFDIRQNLTGSNPTDRKIMAYVSQSVTWSTI